MPSVISQVGFEENGAHTALLLPCEGKEVVSDRPLSQVKHNKITYGKENTEMQKSILEHMDISTVPGNLQPCRTSDIDVTSYTLCM